MFVEGSRDTKLQKKFLSYFKKEKVKSYLSKKNYNVQICTFDETIFKNNTARYPDPPQNLTLQSIINILINQHLYHYLHPYMRKPNGKQITVWGGTSPACTNFYHLFQRTQHDAFFPQGHRFPSKQNKKIFLENGVVIQSSN